MICVFLDTLYVSTEPVLKLPFRYEQMYTSKTARVKGTLYI